VDEWAYICGRLPEAGEISGFPKSSLNMEISNLRREDRVYFSKQ